MNETFEEFENNNLTLMHPDLLSLPEPPPKKNYNSLFDSAFDLRESIGLQSPTPKIKRNSHSNLSNYISSPETEENIELVLQSNNVSELNLMNLDISLSSDESDEIFNIKYDIGNGNMDYITEICTRKMCENAWQAISLTENWDFVAHPIDSFSLPNDKRIDIISTKMEELGYRGHSFASFGITMRNMQYLVQNGEKKFKEIFTKNQL